MNIFSAFNYYAGKILIGFVLIFSVIPIYCNSLNPVMTLTEYNSGSVTLVKRGKVFEVVLMANPTTGYRWEAVLFNKKILKQGTTRFDRQGNTYGAGGVAVFRFEAMVEGETELKIGYARPFDKNQKFERLFEVVIKVYK